LADEADAGIRLTSARTFLHAALGRFDNRRESDS
jgi:heme-degrading monooxygenase HmoA